MKVSTNLRRYSAGLALAVCGALASVACGDDDDSSDGGNTAGTRSNEGGDGGSGGSKTSGGSGGTGATGNAAGEGGGGSAEPKPIYMTGVRVWPTEGPAIQYLKVSHELDTNFTAEDFDTAFETDGYAGVTVQNGYVLIGRESEPFLRKYRITDDLEWEEVGEPLNFTDYYTDDGDGLNFYFQAQKGNDMFFFYGPPERTARVHYQVDEWKIVGKVEGSELPTRDGWLLNNQGNRTGVNGFKDAIVWPFALTPDGEIGTEGVPESYLGVYDGASGEELGVLEPSCPALAHSTLDEDGNFYFSTRDRNPLYGLYGSSVPNCIVKVKPDGELDEDFAPNGELDIQELTGGIDRPGINFRYIGGGKATAMLLNVDGLEGADFSGALQREVFCQVDECEGDMASLFNVELYESYVIDLESKTAKVMTGYDPEYPGFGNYRIYWNVDGVTYFMGYQKDGTNLVIYELDPETAEVKLSGESAPPAEASHEYVQLTRIR